MKKLIPMLVAASGLSALATPVVENVTVEQDNNCRVTVTYDLVGEDAVVTADVFTNGVSIGAAHLTHMDGDVNRLVKAATGKKFVWRPFKAWPSHAGQKESIQVEVKAWSKASPPDYMVVGLAVTNYVRYYASSNTVPKGITDDLYKTEFLLLRRIPAGGVEWRMGSPTGEKGRVSSREKAHLVKLAEDFYIGVYEFTQRQYELLMGTVSPAYFNDTYNSENATRPVEQVAFMYIRDSGAWPTNPDPSSGTVIANLRARTGVDSFDLPLEAQWEFACRAGCGAALYSGKELDDAVVSTNLNALARYKGHGGYVDGTTEPPATCSPDNGTAKVGSFAPNGYGLYDMLGNLWEACRDYYADDNTGAGIDPEKGPMSGTTRVKRGGTWDGTADAVRSAVRGDASFGAAYKNVGFRVMCGATAE